MVYFSPQNIIKKNELGLSADSVALMQSLSICFPFWILTGAHVFIDRQNHTFLFRKNSRPGSVQEKCSLLHWCVAINY